MGDEWGTVAQAAKILGRKERCVQTLCLAGDLKAKKLGRDWRVNLRFARAFKLPRRGPKPKPNGKRST